jgi:hypothetical protein
VNQEPLLLNNTRSPSRFFLFFLFHVGNLSIVFSLLFYKEFDISLLFLFMFYFVFLRAAFRDWDRVLPSSAVRLTFAHLRTSPTGKEDGDMNTTAQGCCCSSSSKKPFFRVDECLTLSDLKYFLQHRRDKLGEPEGKRASARKLLLLLLLLLLTLYTKERDTHTHTFSLRHARADDSHSSSLFHWKILPLPFSIFHFHRDEILFFLNLYFK